MCFSKHVFDTVPVSDCKSRAATSVIVPVQPPISGNLCYMEFLGSSTGEKITSPVDDIALLLMQRSFEKINSPEYQNFLKNVLTQLDNVKQVSKPKMDDKQLLSFIKSRHIQSASELQSWISYLSSQYELLKSDIDGRIKEQLQQQQEQQQQQQQQQEQQQSTLVQGASSAT